VLRRLAALTLLVLPACGVLQRIEQDPDRVCPPGHHLTPAGCVPRETPTPKCPRGAYTREPLDCQPLVCDPALPAEWCRYCVPQRNSTGSDCNCYYIDGKTLNACSATPTPTPTANTQVTPTPTPSATPTPDEDGVVCGADPLGSIRCDCWRGDAYVQCPAPSATPTPAPATATPTTAPTVVQPTRQPTPAPTAAPATPSGGCVDASNAPETPVSIAQAGGCRRWQEPVEFEGEFENPSGLPLCAARSGDRREGRRTSWLLGYGMGRQGMQLVNACGGWLQRNPGRTGYTDALGRRFEDNCSLYENPEDGPRSPWTWGGYSQPELCPTPTVATPPPATPAPRGGSCTCEVVCTVAFLGWNDRAGLPPNVVPGGRASVDVTCRQAQFEGDQRGQPVDRSSGPEWCEPARDPVEFVVSVPDGVRWGAENDGYRLDLSNLQAGGYRIEAQPNRHAVYRNGEPVKLCGWGHGSQRTVLEFEVR
jgi:hypothetical protein